MFKYHFKIHSRPFVLLNLLLLLFHINHNFVLEKALPNADVYISTSRQELADEKTVFVNYESFDSISKLFNFTKPDYIFHLASNCIRDTSDASLKKGQIRDDNIIKILDALRVNVKFIFVSSMAVFSPDDKNIRPLQYRPESNYGLEKLYMIKKLLNLSSIRTHINFKVVYPSSIYGFGQTGRMFLPRLLLHIRDGAPIFAFGGNKKRDFIHVRDVSASLVRLVLDYNDPTNDHIFLHSFKLIKMFEITDLVYEICKLDSKEALVFNDSKEDLERDLFEYQTVAEKYRLPYEFPVKVGLYEGLREMFDVNSDHDYS